jgi:hypothetical protein
LSARGEARRGLVAALSIALAVSGCLVEGMTEPDDTGLTIWDFAMLERGDTIRLTVTTTGGCSDFCYQPVREATWSVAPSQLASIAPQPLDLTMREPTASALLRGLAPGIVTVRVQAGKKHGSTEVRVYPVLESIVLTPAGGTLRVGDTITVTGRMTFEDNARVPDAPFLVWRRFPDGGTGWVADGTLVDNGHAVRVVAQSPGTFVVSAGFLKKSVHASFRVNAR